MTMTNNKTARIICSVLCIALAVCVVFTGMLQLIAKAATPKTYVEDVKIYECEDDDGCLERAKKWFSDNGYVYSGINLNQGTGTDENAYLGYKTTTNKDMAITDIRMMAMDTGYTIYNYNDMMNYIAAQKAGTAQTMYDAAVIFAANYKAGSPKAKDAYDGLNLFCVGDENRIKLGDYIVAGKTNVNFFTKMIMKSGTGTLNTVHGFLCNGIAPWQNDLDEQGKRVTTNWADFTIKSELWDKIGNENLSTDDLNNLHKQYNDSARELFKTIQDFTTYYENAVARQGENNEIPVGETMEEAADKMDEVEREDSDFLYLAAYSMLNEYALSDGTKLGDWFVTLGKINSDQIDLMQLYPVVEAMGKCQASIASSGGFVSAVINLAENRHNEDLDEAIDTAEKKIKDLTDEEAFDIWENCDGEIENSVLAFTSDAVRKSTAENALGRKSNWEKKKEYIAEIEKVANLVMGIMFVALPVLSAVLTLAVAVTKIMAATCIAMAALNTMCIWLLAVVSFLNACMPYIGILVMVATITATVTIMIKEYVMGDKVHIDKQSEKPDFIFDAQEKQNEILDIRYKSVRNDSGAVSDINCGSQIYWCLIAYTKDVRAGEPLCADDSGSIFRCVTGADAAPGGYECVRFFGERTAADCNAYCKKNSVNGCYIYYRTESSPAEENASQQENQPSGDQQDQERNYLADVIVCTGKDTAEAKAKITRHSGKYYIYDSNLSPDCSQATYIGYTMTTDRSKAITDLRVAPYIGVSQQSDYVWLGDIKYSRIDILGISTTYGDEKSKPQADCLYFTTDKSAGEPILANGLHAVTSASEIKNGWEPVSVFSGMPYDFNTALVDDDYADPTAIAWLNDKAITTVSGYKGEDDESEVLNNHRYVNLYTESDKMYTSGTRYLSGLFLIGGYNTFDNSWTHSDDEEYCEKFRDEYVAKEYRTGICGTNLLESLYVAKYVCWNSMQSYLCYNWSYSPKRALYNIEAYQGDNYSLNLNYTMTKVNDLGVSQNYVAATCLYQQCFGLGNARFIRPSNNYVNAFGSGLGIYNFEKCIYDDGYTQTMPEGIKCGYKKIQFLPTGLYVTGYQSGQKPLTLNDVVFSTKAYEADGEGGKLSVTLSGEKTLDGNTPVGAFHGVTDMKNPRSAKPFNLSTPDYYYDGKFRASGKEFYIYISGTKLAKRRYISGLSIGAYSRDQYKATNPKATDDELKAVDAMVEGMAMSAAAGACSDEVLVYNIATDSQGDAWYNRQKDGKAKTEAPENKPAAYIGISRTDAGVSSNDDGTRQRPITGVLLYKLNDTTAPNELEIDSVKYYCAGITTPLTMKGTKYFLYYSYSKGAFPGEPIEEIKIDNIPIINGYATNVCGDRNSKAPYGNPDQTNFIHVKYESDPRTDFFNKIYIGKGNTARAAQCDLLTHGCLEYIDLDANLGVAGNSVYIGFRKGRLDLDKINGKSTESAKEKERNTQLREAIYDIIITDDEPYHSDGIVRNNIYYKPVGQADLTAGMGHKLYMYYTSPWYSSRYNTTTGKNTLLPQNVFSGYLTHLALGQYDRVPYNSALIGTANIQDTIRPWEYVMLADGSRPADLNEGTIAFTVESNTCRYAYDNRIKMFAQRSDGSVKPAGEITGGFVDKNVAVGSAYINS